MTILANRWDGTEESAQWTNSAINAVIDTLVNADMWTGDPPYRGKTPAEQVQMLVDERNALRAKLDAVPVKAISEFMNRVAFSEEGWPSGYEQERPIIDEWLNDVRVKQTAVQP